MTKRRRRRFSPEEKFTIVKQVLSKARTVSEITEEYGIHPDQYCKWQKEFFESTFHGFKEKSLGKTRVAEERDKKHIEAEIQRMKDIVAEMVSENIEKKNME